MSGTANLADMIARANIDRPDPIVEGLLRENEILLVHAPEESFKSVFIIQVGIAIASATPLLGVFPVHTSRKVGVLQTEMHPGGLGERLAKMVTGPYTWADRMIFLVDDGMKVFKREPTMQRKLEIVKQWVVEHEIDVLLIDPANDFFRGDDSTSEEAAVGTFFDELRTMGLDGIVLIRHDRKPGINDTLSPNTNNLIRGSSEWKEDPETIIHLRRKDPRHTEVELEVGKLRYGKKPDPMDLWFDAGTFTLTVLPPLVQILKNGPVTRDRLVREAKERFGIGRDKVDGLRKTYDKFLLEGYQGHDKTFELNLPLLDRIAKDPDDPLKPKWAVTFQISN